MKLYFDPHSPNSRRVLATVHHLGMEVDRVAMDASSPETKQEWYLRLNPNGRVPTLVDGDFVLWESNAIAHYLVDRHGESDLALRDPHTRADVLRWECWQLAHFGVACTTLTWENGVKAFMGQAPDPAAVEQGLALFRACGAVLDGHLASRSFVVGSSVTLADYGIAACLMFAELGKMPLAELPNVARWYERVCTLPAWQRSRPPAMEGVPST